MGSAAPVDPAARLRALAHQLAEGFRRSDRFARMRLGIVAAWVAVSVATIAAACPSYGPGNSLGADVRLARDTVVGSQIMVRNDSDDIWTDVVLTLDGQWVYQHATLRPSDQLVVPTTQFRRSSELLPPEYRPRKLEVACRQGSHTFDVR